MSDRSSTRALKAMADSATYLAEIVGEESLQGQRMQARRRHEFWREHRGE